MGKLAINTDFKTVAGLASEVEQAGDYGYAANLWRKAATLARKQINYEWCISRSQFLDTWARRLTGKGENKEAI